MRTDLAQSHREPDWTVQLFDLLSDETRFRIVDELYQTTDHSVRFSDLSRRIEADDPGRFNYHLKRLQGQLVEKVDTGYRLSDEGHRIADAIFGVVRTSRGD